MADFLPRSDGALAAWIANAAGILASDPGAYGLSPEAVAPFLSAQALFAERYAIATSPSTRTAPAIAAKDQARADLVRTTRFLCHGVRGMCGTDGTTPAQLILLGLKPDGRFSPRRTPLPLPAAPLVNLSSPDGRSIRVRVADRASPSRRARPDAARGITLFRHIGEAPPTVTTRWQHLRTSSKMMVDVPMKNVDVQFGTRVWFTCAWYDTQGRRGDMSDPVSIRITSESPVLPSTLAA